MGLFGTSKKEEAKKEMMPQLPSLPRLPDFPGSEEEMMQIHELPSLPSSYLGTKFSQNTIKDAVTGEEEVDDYADDFADDDSRMMQEPLRKPMTTEMGYQRFSQGSRGRDIERGAQGPVFIRLDRFEEAMSVFGTIKRKISEIESSLEEIKRVREKEESELVNWESEIKSMKNQIEKVDRDIFSKL